MRREDRLMVFSLDEQRYALALAAVEKVVRAVEVTRLPKAPDPGGRNPAVPAHTRGYSGKISEGYYGGDVVAGLLTGMGRDGADELRLLKDKGALTFVQDKGSCVVHGMPGEAIRLDAATLVLTPQKIAAMLAHLANNRK